MNLSDPILSRFDAFCIVKDTVNEEVDRKLARFVVGSHFRNHPHFAEEDDEVLRMFDEEVEEVENNDSQVKPISQELLKKYITFARDRIHPKLHSIDQDKIANMYAELRRESMVRYYVNFDSMIRYVQLPIFRILNERLKLIVSAILMCDYI